MLFQSIGVLSVTMDRQIGAGSGQGRRSPTSPPSTNSHPHLMPPSEMLELILNDLQISPDRSYLEAIQDIRAAIASSTPLIAGSLGHLASLHLPPPPPPSSSLSLTTTTTTTSMHCTQIMSTFSQVTPSTSPDSGFVSNSSVSQVGASASPILGTPPLLPHPVLHHPAPPDPSLLAIPLFSLLARSSSHQPKVIQLRLLVFSLIVGRLVFPPDVMRMWTWRMVRLMTLTHLSLQIQPSLFPHLLPIHVRWFSLKLHN